jgi:alkylation response protein AidB-like acyl-CoA dehydrogenase
MDLDLDDDQLAIRDLFAGFFEKESTPSLVRECEPLGFAPSLWDRLRELDIDAMATDSGLLSAVLAAEQAGRHLAPVPFAEHMATVRLLQRVGTTPPPPGPPLTLALLPVGESAHLVPGGAVADAFVALRGDELLLVPGSAPQVAVPNGAGLPLATRAVAVDATVLATGVTAAALHGSAVDEWRLMTAAALVGLAASALELGVAYVTERHQFGVPIGSFQAIQHGLAEFPGPLSGARLLVLRAAWRADTDEQRLSVDAPMALLFAAELARTVTNRVLHYHGGYGVMEEYDIQLHYRRARGWPAQLGDPALEVDRLGDLLYGPGKAN